MVASQIENTQKSNFFKPDCKLFYKPKDGIFRLIKNKETTELAEVEIIPVRYLYKLDNMEKQSSLVNCTWNTKNKMKYFVFSFQKSKR